MQIVKKALNENGRALGKSWVFLPLSGRPSFLLSFLPTTWGS